MTELQSAATRSAANRSLGWGMRWAGLWVVASQILRVVRGLIVPKLLDPAHYGLFTSLSVLLGYAQYADLGVYDQLGKRLPQRLAQEGEAGFRQFARLGATWELFTMLLVGGSVLIYSVVYAGPDQDFYRPAFRIIALVIVTQNLRTLVAAMIRARSDFKHLAIGSMALDIVGLMAGVALLLLFGVIGLVWGLLCAEIVALTYFVRVAGFPGFTRSLRGLRVMVQEGGLLLAVALIEQTLMTTDQIFLLAFFPREQYGIYALGLFATSALLAGSGIFLTVIQPRVMALHARDQIQEAMDTVNASLTLYLLGLAVVVGALILVIDLMVYFYIPKYSAGMAAFTLMPLLALARAPVILLRPYFIARNREKFVIGCQLTGLLVAVGLDLLVVAGGGGLPQIALASVTGYMGVTALFVVNFERHSAHMDLAKYGLMAMCALGILGLFRFYALRPGGVETSGYVRDSLLAALAYSLWISAALGLGRRRWRAVWTLFRQRPTDKVDIR